MALIPERVWQLLTAEERQTVLEVSDGWRWEPRVECPQCGTVLGIRLKIGAAAARIDENGDVVVPEKAVAVPSNQGLEARLIIDARTSGLLDGFEQAVNAVHTSNRPADVGAFFITFLKTMAAKKVPRFVVDRYVRELQTQRLDFWSAQGICAVTGDGVIRTFVPLALLLGQPMYGIGKNATRMGAHPEKLDEWVRCRFGYVPATSKAFLDEMRKRSLGEFQDFVQ